MAASSSQEESAESLSNLRKLITAEDQKTIAATWSKFFGNAEENGRRIFIRFFTDYPDSKGYFKTIPTEGDLLRNRELGFHARRVMVALDTMITSLMNRPRLSSHIGRLVENHKDKHGVPVVMFQFLLQTVLNVIQDILGEEFTPDSMASWQKFIGVILAEIRAAYISESTS